MKNEIKELRIKIDGLAQLTKDLEPIPCKVIPNEGTPYEYGISSKEIEKTVDSLYLAKAWLGKVLGELKEDSPYANDGKRKTIKDIESTSDVNDKVSFNDSEGDLWGDKNHIEKVDWLRQEIENLMGILEFRKINLSSTEITQTNGVYHTKDLLHFSILNSLKYLCEARFWLGFELQRIKNSN